MKGLERLQPVAVALIALVMSSCDHKELCYHHDHRVTLRVEFDWRDAPEASPQGMAVWFYPAEGTEGTPLRFDFKGTRGGEVRVPEGKYHLISYNNDTELSIFDGADAFHTHYAYTRPGSVFEHAAGSRSSRAGNEPPRPDGTENEGVVISPDEIWGCNAIDVEVSAQGVSYICYPLEEKSDWPGLPPVVTEHVITLFPHDHLCHYSYEVRNVRNLGSVPNMCAVLSGMSPTLHLHDESLGTESITIPLPAYRADEKTIRGEFLTFGHHEANEAPHRFGLYLWLRGGKTLFYGKDAENFNVTDQIHAAPDRRRVHFIIDGLEVPPVVGDGGWDVSFEDWIVWNGDIIME